MDSADVVRHIRVVTVSEPAVPVDDGVYHVIRFIRAGSNATLQVRALHYGHYGTMFQPGLLTIVDLVDYSTPRS